MKGKGMTRKEVYEALDSEMEYKIKLWHDYQNNDKEKNNPLEVGEFLCLIDQYVAQAKEVWVSEKKPCTKTLDVIRKIGGIIVDCGEQHGLPNRKD